jgi:hypothetical protein
MFDIFAEKNIFAEIICAFIFHDYYKSLKISFVLSEPLDPARQIIRLDLSSVAVQ